MKKIIWVAIVLLTGFFHKSYSQDSLTQNQLSKLLSHYYNIKDALVAGNAGKASSEAEQYVQTLNGIEFQTISEGNANALLKDASLISESKDINRQRGYFANFSNNMIVLAKSIKLSSAPIYEAYCPMKKASWLSADNTIKNPYFGSAMLSCGKVVETINQ